MAQKGFLSWVGFKGESTNVSNAAGESMPTVGGLERIRELESQLADLRSRKDITSLTREEFEILATETAMNLVRTAQHREKSASSQAAKILAESSKIAQEATAAAEAKAKSILSAAENRGRKYLEAAESEIGELKLSSERAARALAEAARKEADSIRSKSAEEIEALLASKKREASAITTAAKNEAEKLVEEAVANVGNYKSWLVSAVAEAERLFKVQTQSLTAAQQAIEQSRQRLAHSFEKLTSLTAAVEENLALNNRPTSNEFGKSENIDEATSASTKSDSKKRAVKKSAARKPAAKKQATKKPATKKPATKKVAKKRAVKKSSRR